MNTPRAQVITEIERMRALVTAYADGSPAPSVPRPTSRFDDLAVMFGLSRFERDVIALAAAVELDGELGARVAGLSGGGDPRPTFGLALAVLADPHWDALAPDGPLRRWLLVTLGPGATLATRPITLDEQVLHWLVGIAPADAGLAGLVRNDATAQLTPTHRALADEVVRAIRTIDGQILVRLDGDDPSARAAVAHHIADSLGLRALVLRDDTIDPSELTRTARLVDRATLLYDVLPVTSADQFADRLAAPVVVALGDGEAIPGRVVLRRTISLPAPAEQRALWRDALGDDEGKLDATTEELAAHYRLPAQTVQAVAGEYLAAQADVEDRSDLLRRLTRDRARAGVDGLAERITLGVCWDDLVLPAGQLMLLRDLAAQVRHRTTVHETWGFADRVTRGLGVTALFAGESGTGKTMAAEVIAGDLGLDLYRIDLSAVVSKYIGETEKNLRRLFESAEGSGAVLLFDEADALFGKRSEVRDSHDRYANLEVAYLLQRMESYRGLAILTSNLRSNVDRAFLRRLRFVVQFPFPDKPLRVEIWRRAFPPRAPIDGLDPAVLAHMQISGAAIRSIALGAAFAAAQAGTPITAAHVLHAARIEYAKSERAPTRVETAGLER